MPHAQFDVSLRVAVSLYCLCRAQTFAVSLPCAVSRPMPCVVHLQCAMSSAPAVCRVPPYFVCRPMPCASWQRGLPGWQAASQESTGSRRVASLPCASTWQRTFGSLALVRSYVHGRKDFSMHSHRSPIYGKTLARCTRVVSTP
jgi:hypothetical protein